MLRNFIVTLIIWSMRLTLAGISFTSMCWLPRQIVVEIFALLTVDTLGVVGTLALTVYL